MAFRLNVFEKEDLTVIRVDGRLAGDEVTQIESACRTARRPLVLDLTHLVAADDAGVLALRRLAGAGAHLVGVSPYITLLLGAGGAGPAFPARPEQPRRRPTRRRPAKSDR